MSDAQLYEDTFTIASINNQKYDRVSRLAGTSNDNTISMTLDINHELFPVSVGESIQLVLASTLNLDGTKDESRGWRDMMDSESLADLYDYVCHGKVYRFEEAEGENIRVFVSFGGLLLFMEGPYRRLTPLRIDYVYLLLKK